MSESFHIAIVHQYESVDTAGDETQGNVARFGAEPYWTTAIVGGRPVVAVPSRNDRHHNTRPQARTPPAFNRIKARRRLPRAGAFATLAAATIASDASGWLVTPSVSLATTVVVVLVEMRKSSYHGVGWQRINPGLSAWCESRMDVAAKADQ